MVNTASWQYHGNIKVAALFYLSYKQVWMQIMKWDEPQYVRECTTNNLARDQKSFPVMTNKEMSSWMLKHDQNSTKNLTLKTPALQRDSERAILHNYSEVDACHCYWSILLLWQAQGSCDAPASVYLYSNTGWPHASTPHFSFRQILHIFDLQYTIIGHQLNYYWGVIILNLSVKNCRNMKEWLIISTFACGSKNNVLFLLLIENIQSKILIIFVNVCKERNWKEHTSL